MSEYTLKHLQPAQYESWLRKVDDPDWYGHRYRDQKDHAMASAIRELRDALSQRNELLEALKMMVATGAPVGTFGDVAYEKSVAAIAKAEGK